MEEQKVLLADEIMTNSFDTEFVNEAEEAKEEKPVQYALDKDGKPYGPYQVNRKWKRQFIAQNAAKNKRRVAASCGFRGNAPVGYPEAIGVN